MQQCIARCKVQLSNDVAFLCSPVGRVFTLVVMVLSSRTGRNVVCSECPLPTLVLCTYLEVVLGHSGRNCGGDEVPHVLLNMTITAGSTTETLIPHMLPGFCASYSSSAF